MTIEYCFVIDANKKQLSPTKANKAWYLIRKGRAILKQKYPMLIQLTRAIKDEDIDKTEIVLGIDDGSKNVGIGLLHADKAIFKATLEHRGDVKELLDARRGYRRYRRSHKRYRPARFSNRSTGKRKGRIAPSIKQKRSYFESCKQPKEMD